MQAHGQTAASRPRDLHCVAAQSSRTHRRVLVQAHGGYSRRTTLLLPSTLMGAQWLQGMSSPAQAIELSQVFSQVFPAPPQPVFFPRKVLDIKFAVLLMRSGYEAVDALDYMAMDKFQVAFFKYRQSEQEGYMLQYNPLKVRLGDLTDPLFFDYISYVQFAVAGREMPKGQQVFEEFCEECDNNKRVVRRDPALADNAVLPERFTQLVGDNIYNGLRNGFRGEQFGGPQPLPASAPLAELVQGVQALLDIMVARGFALKAEASVVPASESPKTFRIQTQGSANLWGLSSLAFRRSPILNTYDSMAIQAWLRASGRSVKSVQFAMTDISTEHTFILA